MPQRGKTPQKPGAAKTTIRPVGMAANDKGQMMLLAGFIFVIGLLAMSATLARVPLLAKQVPREQDRPLLAHFEPMMDGLNDALVALPTHEPDSAKHKAAVEGMLDHLRAVEASHGFFLEWKIECVGGLEHVQVKVTDGLLWIDADSVQLALC